MNSSTRDLLRRLNAAGLLAAEKLTAYEASGLVKTDPDKLSYLLVERGELTEFQRSCALGREVVPLQVGRYVLIEKIGAGGMGLIFKARSLERDQVVALKVLAVHTGLTADSRGRFEREAHALERLSHPHIVALLDAGEAGGFCYLAMTLEQGIDLSEYVRRHGPLTVVNAVRCLLQAAQGLEYVHLRGVIHRDLKPSNLMLTDSGNIKILDLGLARLTDLEISPPPNADDMLTHTGIAIGTPAFMAPEQVDDSRTADARSDLYSLGFTFFYLLTGRDPYAGMSKLEKLLAHLNEDPPDLRECRPDAPPAVCAVYSRLVEKDPENRYQSASELIEALTPLLPQLADEDDVTLRIHGPLVPVEEDPFSVQVRHDPTEHDTVISEVFIQPMTTTAIDLRRRKRLTNWALLLLAVLLAVVAGIQWSLAAHLFDDDEPTLPLPPPTSSRLDPALLPGSVHVLQGHDATVKTVDISPDGLRALSGDADGVVLLWDLETGEILYRLDGHTDKVWDVCFSPDGRQALSCGRDQTIRLWDLTEGITTQMFMRQTAVVTAVDFLPDGKRFVSASFDLSLVLWDIETGHALRTFRYTEDDVVPEMRIDNRDRLDAHISWIRDVKVFPTGDRMASAGNDATGLIWDLETGDVLARFTGHTTTITKLALADGGRLAYTTSYDLSAQVWNTYTGETQARFEGHVSPIQALGVTQDGRRVLTGADDNLLILWDAATGRELRRFEGHRAGIGDLAITPDGRFVLTGSSDSTLRLWRLPD